jgi:hypothetical protein
MSSSKLSKLAKSGASQQPEAQAKGEMTQSEPIKQARTTSTPVNPLLASGKINEEKTSMLSNLANILTMGIGKKKKEETDKAIVEQSEPKTTIMQESIDIKKSELFDMKEINKEESEIKQPFNEISKDNQFQKTNTIIEKEMQSSLNQDKQASQSYKTIGIKLLLPKPKVDETEVDLNSSNEIIKNEPKILFSPKSDKIMNDNFTGSGGVFKNIGGSSTEKSTNKMSGMENSLDISEKNSELELGDQIRKAVSSDYAKKDIPINNLQQDNNNNKGGDLFQKAQTLKKLAEHPNDVTETGKNIDIKMQAFNKPPPGKVINQPIPPKVFPLPNESKKLMTSAEENQIQDSKQYDERRIIDQPQCTKIDFKVEKSDNTVQTKKEPLENPLFEIPFIKKETSMENSNLIIKQNIDSSSDVIPKSPKGCVESSKMLMSKPNHQPVPPKVFMLPSEEKKLLEKQTKDKEQEDNRVKELVPGRKINMEKKELDCDINNLIKASDKKSLDESKTLSNQAQSLKKTDIQFVTKTEIQSIKKSDIQSVTKAEIQSQKKSDIQPVMKPDIQSIKKQESISFKKQDSILNKVQDDSSKTLEKQNSLVKNRAADFKINGKRPSITFGIRYLLI